MNILVTYDASVSAAPATFKTAIAYVVNLYDAILPSSATVNIDVGYGEYGAGASGAPASGYALDSGALGENIAEEYLFSYSQVVTAMKTTATTPEAIAADATLPASDPTGSQGGNLAISTAEAKALGLVGPSSAPDGYVGFSNTSPFTYDPNNQAVSGEYDFIGVVEHEFAEVLGRFSGYDFSPVNASIQDLFRYASAGALATSAGGSAYFSINGGATALDYFNTAISNGDLGDWSSSAGADAFLAVSPPGSIDGLSTADLTMLDVLGYGAASVVVTSGHSLTVSSGASSAGVAVLSGGALNVLSGGNVIGATLASGAVETVSSGGMMTGATVASGATLFDYGFASSTVLSGGVIDVMGAGGTTRSTSGTGTYVLGSGALVSAGLFATSGVAYRVASGGETLSTTFMSGVVATVLAGGIASSSTGLPPEK